MENKSICKIDEDGNKFWYLNNLQHREDGPAVEMVDGTKRWYINGNLHREDGPTIIRINGIKEYYIHNKRHRFDGPAWISGVSSFRNEWFINGILVTPEITKWAKEHNIDLDNLTDVDIALIKISFT